MLQRKSNKDSSTKQASSAKEVTTSISHRRRDDHGNETKSRIMTGHNHSPDKSIRRAHAISGIGSIQNVSLVIRQRRRPEENILQV